MRGKSLGRLVSAGVLLALMPTAVQGTDADVLRPRVPADQREIVKGWVNPFPPTPENVEQGRALYHGKAFCVTCHGRQGKGFEGIAGLVGPLPRNFTDRIWQATRSDGELFWILKNGSPGTDMASFVPLVLTEEEAWKVLLYVRSFDGQ
jgi:mono/diheme cytochrome c family protein